MKSKVILKLTFSIIGRGAGEVFVAHTYPTTGSCENLGHARNCNLTSLNSSYYFMFETQNPEVRT